MNEQGRKEGGNEGRKEGRKEEGKGRNERMTKSSVALKRKSTKGKIKKTSGLSTALQERRRFFHVWKLYFLHVWKLKD